MDIPYEVKKCNVAFCCYLCISIRWHCTNRLLLEIKMIMFSGAVICLLWKLIKLEVYSAETKLKNKTTSAVPSWDSALNSLINYLVGTQWILMFSLSIKHIIMYRLTPPREPNRPRIMYGFKLYCHLIFCFSAPLNTY